MQAKRWLKVAVLAVVALPLAAAALAPTPLDEIEIVVAEFVTDYGFVHAGVAQPDVEAVPMGSAVSAYRRDDVRLEDFNVMCERLRRCVYFGESMVSSGSSIVHTKRGYLVVDTVASRYTSTNNWGVVTVTLEFDESHDDRGSCRAVVSKKVTDYFALIRAKIRI